MDVCAKLRGLFHEKRIGHAGTLDPMATGVLPVFVGRATRAVEFASEGDKEYLAGLRLGTVTEIIPVTRGSFTVGIREDSSRWISSLMRPIRLEAIKTPPS